MLKYSTFGSQLKKTVDIYMKSIYNSIGNYALFEFYKFIRVFRFFADLTKVSFQCINKGVGGMLV